jgi:uncharacterized membrane protein YraQ (UPF0718 family)
VRAASPAAQRRLAALPKEFLNTGVRLLAMFVGFAFIGYLLNGLVPAAWVSTLFGARKLYGVPLAATIGLLLYVSFEASLPLVRALLDSGISQGAVMAFLIAGSGTSIGAIAGALTIARWRVVALVVAVLWIGAMGACRGLIPLLRPHGVAQALDVMQDIFARIQRRRGRLAWRAEGAAGSPPPLAAG